MSVHTRLPHPESIPSTEAVSPIAFSTVWPPLDHEYGLRRVVKPHNCGYPVDEVVEYVEKILDPDPDNKNTLQRALYGYLGVEKITYDEHYLAVTEVSVPSTQAIRQKLGELSLDIPDFEEVSDDLLPGDQLAAMAQGKMPIATTTFGYADDLFVRYLPGWALAPPKAIENITAVAGQVLAAGDPLLTDRYLNHMRHEGLNDMTFWTLNTPAIMHGSAAAAFNDTAEWFAATASLELVTSEEVKEHHARMAAALAIRP